MTNHNKVFLLLGSNIEPRYNYIKKAEEEINESIGQIIHSSHIYESEPVGFKAEVSFLNCVLLVNSSFSALTILKHIHKIEKELGRERNSLGYTSRTIDIDILYFNNDIINTEDITVPHARLHERKFTLLPLVEIAPDYINPKLNKNNTKLFDLCTDRSKVSRYKNR